MPPRYAYWTILVDDQPTAFRAGMQEDLLPTFKRLKAKHPSAKMMWFQNGKLWTSRLEAQEAMRERGERGRSADPKQFGFRARKKPDWKPRGVGENFSSPKGERPTRRERPEWKPRAEAERPPRTSRPPAFAKAPTSAKATVRKPAGRQDLKTSRPLEWKPKGEFTPAPRRTERSERPEWKPKTSRPQDLKTSRPRENAKLDWKPRDESAARPSTRDELPRRKPAARSGSGRDKNWRPGGEHKDPRQKYKDAKKAKWTRFKQTVRKRWEGKQGKKGGK